VQGELGGVIASVKILGETKLIEAGSSIVEGLDRLFKTYYAFNFSYPDTCANVYSFLQHRAYGITEGKKPTSTVAELIGLLKKFE